MIKHITLLFTLTFSLLLNAQKVNLDRAYVKVAYIKLPTNPILDKNKRTFSFQSNVHKVEDNINLYGFESIEKDGDVEVSLYFDEIITDEITIKEKKHEKKDKEGKVIKRWHTYYAILKYTTSGAVKYQTSNTKGRKPYPIEESEERKKNLTRNMMLPNTLKIILNL